MKIEITPRWEEIPSVRQRTQAFLRERGLPADVVDSLAMISSELTENAIKYGSFSSARARLTVELRLSPKDVTVEVTNPIGTGAGQDLLRLDRMIQWIRGFQDPFEAYLRRFKEVSGQALDNPESRLGLVRIAYEGQASLDFYVDENHTLAVSAVREL